MAQNVTNELILEHLKQMQSKLSNMAPDEFKKLETEINNAADYSQRIRAEAAHYARAVLEKNIPNWSDDLHNAIRSYAVSQGFPREQVDTCLDPRLIQVWHAAMMVDLEIEKWQSSLH